MDTRQRKLKYYTDKLWTGRDHEYKLFTPYKIAQDMKKARLCKHDMDCYRMMLMGVIKHHRPK